MVLYHGGKDEASVKGELIEPEHSKSNLNEDDTADLQYFEPDVAGRLQSRMSVGTGLYIGLDRVVIDSVP